MKHQHHTLKDHRDERRNTMNISKKSQGAVALVVMLPLILALSGCYDDQPVAGARIKVTDSSKDASRSSSCLRRRI